MFTNKVLASTFSGLSPSVIILVLSASGRSSKDVVMLVRIIFIFVFILHYNFTGLFNGTWSNNQSFDNSDHNSTSAQKAGDDDWGESSFLGAAVGILVTVVLAAISAIILVLVRNRRQKKCLSELAHYNNMNTGTSSSIQSSLTSKGYKVYMHQLDVIQAERIEQNSDKDILMMDMINRQGKMEAGTECKPPNLSLPSVSKSPISVSPPKFSSNPNTFVHSKVTSWLPHKTAHIKYNCNTPATDKQRQIL